MMNPNPNPNPPPAPVDESALAGAMTAAASSLRTIRKTLCQLVADGRPGILGERATAVAILDAEAMASSLETLAARLAPPPRGAD
jgi:hypothetical protein